MTFDFFFLLSVLNLGIVIGLFIGTIRMRAQIKQTERMMMNRD